MPEAKFCVGCGHPIALMALNKVLDEMGLTKKAVLGLDIGCSLLAWNYLPVNTFQTHHGRVTPTMLAFKRARPGSICLAYAGDGGSYAIGWQSLFHAARRDEPITVIVINNTIYAMTGGQTAPTTMHGEKTPTSPNGYPDEPFHGPEILKDIVKPGAYIARTAVNDMAQMRMFIKKAIETQQAGHFSLVEFLSLCPVNWHTNGPDTLKFLEENMKPVFKVGEIAG
ncbi:2-oxoglutarate synthase [Patescibacteria group bacterium]|nr:2-oxoglutarate synthase [Patescibacteria group bacterium]MBU1613017.1 2-oxoglutarate synthase [Patescibacteria group bacterium]